jgi:4-amino-4-deoxy-L-arabinose transferase-like glycosyltransferase
MSAERGAAPWPTWLGMLVLAAVALLGIGGYPLFDVDEGAFSEATREMLASGDYLHTTLNGVDRFDKPIGVYWLQALSVSAFGLGEFALRLPSALCALGWGLALLVFARERWGERSGWAAAVLLACSAGVLAIGRAATADALLNLLITLAGLDLWRALERAERTPLRRAALWIGLGLLVKGPVAVVVPGAAVLLWCLTSRRWDRLRFVLSDPLAWGLMLVVAVPWYVYALNRHGQAFIDGFLMRHNVNRFSATMEGHGGNPLYYVVMLPVLWLPASVLLWDVLRQWRRWWADTTTRYLLGWAVFVLAFFSASGTQLPHYVLYGASPLALLLGRVFVEAGPGMQRALWLNLLLWAALLAAGPLGLPWWAPSVREPLYASLVAQAPAAPWVGLAVGAGAALMALGLRLSGRWAFAPAWGGAALALTLTTTLVVAPWWAETLQGPVRRLAVKAAELGGPVVQWSLHQPSFAVYRQAPVPRRAPEPGELALTRADRLPADLPHEVIAREGQLLLVRRLAAPEAAK